jgi:hypothetical protein
LLVGSEQVAEMGSMEIDIQLNETTVLKNFKEKDWSV